ncbi:GNAT family N-acetyltransferase [Vibrio hangzhouensis]|uniref:Acetyltransferase (GNAT) domain-containing protein n=1 Tax=Vibrio hangzhouensis TaxID=462991 RepID=A0A1H5W384_9VIBR|nr:Acetyltransferase (GNAT) domain-containing protein [Vibrio hangzhouensis]
MQFVSRDLDVFRFEFDLVSASKELANNFECSVLQDIRESGANDREYLRWVMVATDKDKPIGYCYFRHHIQNSHTYIGHIYVDDTLRGQGIALKLLNMSLDFIFSVLPNVVKISFRSEEHNESRLVRQFLHRASQQKKRDKYFSIEAFVNDRCIELDT